MAEVRPIPSAVGAFEAQVIDFNKTYKAIVDNASAIRKRQAQAQKDIEKQLDLMMVDKRTTRSQDDNVIFNARKEANDFFYNNKSSLDAGDVAKRKQLNEKMAKATSLITKSVSERIEDEKTLPVLKEAMKDANYYEDDLVELIRKRELPLDEREGLTFDRNGVATPIDQFNVTDLKYMKKFDEVKLDDAITRNVKPYTPDKLQLTFNKKLGLYQDRLTELNIYDPYGIAGQTESFANTQPKGFLRHYAPQLAVYKSLPQKDKDLELNGVIDAYKDATGVDMSLWFAKQGGTAGIDNELELATFKKLQSHLPQTVKDTYDYRTQNVLLNQWRLGLARQKFNDIKKTDEDLRGFDAMLTEAVKNRKFNPDEWNSYMNNWANIGNAGTGSVRTAKYNFSKPDANGRVTVTYETQVPLRDDNDKVMTSSNIDVNAANERVSRKVGVKAKVSPDGIWYAAMERTVVLDPKDAGMPSQVSTMNSYVEEAFGIESAKKEFGSARRDKRKGREFIPED